MGRVAYYWKKAFEASGYEFVHIGPEEVGPIRHPYLFPSLAWKYFKASGLKPAGFIVHEPASGIFTNSNIPSFLESHGIEQRHWNMRCSNEIPGESPSLKTKLLFPIWRLRNCNKGLRHADKLLLINNEDASFTKKIYGRKENDIFVFKNGVAEASEHTSALVKIPNNFTVLFNGSWILRKGTQVLVEAARRLHQKGYTCIHYLLIGTGAGVEEVTADWPEPLRTFINVIPHFNSKDEQAHLASADVFVLPSYFEGQPLSLLQAMANGKCCITTDCCGQKDIVNNGENGFLFPIGDAEKLAQLIEACIHQPEMANKIGTTAAKDMKARTWEGVSMDLAKFVLENINNRTNNS